MEIQPEGAYEIASRSRGTPRIANRFLRRVRDFAQVCADGVITKAAADLALEQLDVDHLGLDAIDRRMLTAIIQNYGGGPVGLDTLAATDHLGLDAIDRRMLTAIIQNYGGGPVGLDTLAATIGEESVTLEDVYEPYLMQLGFLTRTPRGRCVTPLAYEHLHIACPGQMQIPL